MSEVMIDDIIINLTSISLFFIFHIYLRFKFSGTPYLSDELKNGNRVMIGFTFYLSLSRIVTSIVNIYLAYNEKGIFDLISSPPDELIWK